MTIKNANRIYVAGPITPTSDDMNHALEYIENVRVLSEISNELLELGFAPFNPSADFMTFVVRKSGLREHQVKRASLLWLKVSDAMLLTQDAPYSAGVLDEIKFANAYGVPIYSMQEFAERYYYLEAKRIFLSWPEKVNQELIK